jgi:ATP-binding cassette, subfamily B, multidrug efflux pump
MARLWQFARRYARRWSWGFVLLLLTNAAAMAIPQLFRTAIDGIEHEASLETLRGLSLVVVLIAACGAIFRALSRIHIFYAARDVEMDLRNAFYAQLTRMPASFFERHPTGDLMSRATNDLAQIRIFLGPGVLNIVNTSIAYAVAVPLMAMISWELTLLTLMVYPPSLLLFRAISRRLYQRNLTQQAHMGVLSNLVQESLAGAHVIRALGREEHQRARFEVANAALYAANVDLAWMRSAMFRLVQALGNLGVLLAVFFGARSVLAGRITTGELVAAVEYMALLSWPTFALGWVLSSVQRGASSMERLNEILAADPSIAGGTQAPAELPARIELRDLAITFAERTVLDGVSLVVPEGTTLGVVGPVGGGKTTLVRALMHLVEVERGQVFVGGVDVRDLDLDRLRAMFGYVSQHHVLFSKSLAENVAFGSTEADRAAIVGALERASFAADLAALPQGLDTPIGERGVMLSGGQKQRTSLARALILDPEILVLDDALSSVDTETEQRILEHLRDMRRDKTTIIVAHRISAVQHADHVIVLDGGRVVEQGDHVSLCAAGGVYARMARRQQLEREVGEGEAAVAS